MDNYWFETRKECPACASDNFKTIYENRFDEFPIKDYLSEIEKYCLEIAQPSICQLSQPIKNRDNTQ